MESGSKRVQDPDECRMLLVARDGLPQNCTPTEKTRVPRKNSAILAPPSAYATYDRTGSISGVILHGGSWPALRRSAYATNSRGFQRRLNTIPEKG